MMIFHLTFFVLCYYCPVNAVVCQNYNEPKLQMETMCYVAEDRKLECDQLTERHRYVSGVCYVFDETLKTHAQAKTGCNHIASTTGHLLYLDSNPVSLVMDQLLEEVGLTINGQFWMGLEHDTGWVWGNGVPEAENLWYLNQTPVETTPEICGTWAYINHIVAADCNIMLKSICQYDTVVPPNHCTNGEMPTTSPPAAELTSVITQMYGTSAGTLGTSATGNIIIFLNNPTFNIGDTITIEGYVTPPPPLLDFTINFNIDRTNIVFHMRPIWNLIWLVDMVAFDTMKDSQWQVPGARRISPNPVAADAQFKIEIKAGAANFEVTVNGNHFYDYPYVVYSPTDIKYLYIIAPPPYVYIYNVRHSGVTILGPPSNCVSFTKDENTCKCTNIFTGIEEIRECTINVAHVCPYLNNVCEKATASASSGYTNTEFCQYTGEVTPGSNLISIGGIYSCKCSIGFASDSGQGRWVALNCESANTWKTPGSDTNYQCVSVSCNKDDTTNVYTNTEFCQYTGEVEPDSNLIAIGGYCSCKCIAGYASNSGQGPWVALQCASANTWLTPGSDTNYDCVPVCSTAPPKPIDEENCDFSSVPQRADSFYDESTISTCTCKTGFASSVGPTTTIQTTCTATAWTPITDHCVSVCETPQDAALFPHLNLGDHINCQNSLTRTRTDRFYDDSETYSCECQVGFTTADGRIVTTTCENHNWTNFAACVANP